MAKMVHIQSILGKQYYPMVVLSMQLAKYRQAHFHKFVVVSLGIMGCEA